MVCTGRLNLERSATNKSDKVMRDDSPAPISSSEIISLEYFTVLNPFCPISEVHFAVTKRIQKCYR